MASSPDFTTAKGGSDDGTDDDTVVVINRDDVSDYNPEQILPQPRGTINKIRAWLQPTQYRAVGGEYRKHLNSHMSGTGSWLTATTTYQTWLKNPDHGLLWIQGIPGSGKSVIAAKLAHELATREQTTASSTPSYVLFFFFRQIIKANHTPEALLRDWLDQILEYSPPLQLALKSLLESNDTVESLSTEKMLGCLRMAFNYLTGTVYCVADALDEMDQGNDTFLKSLASLGQWRPDKVKVLITSRPVPSVQGPLNRTSSLRIRLDEDHVDTDIFLYVEHRLAASQIPRSDWQVIKNAVPGRANGLFLYAKLAMDGFLEPDADAKDVLSRLPADLNVLYTDLLKEHARRSGIPPPIQHLILQAMTHTARPLRLLELAELVMVHVNSHMISDDHITSSLDLKVAKDMIRAACGPLLEILPDETVSVIHHSFTEYLKGITRQDGTDASAVSGNPILRPGSTHAQLAQACLRYLQAGCLDSIQVMVKDCVDSSVIEYFRMNGLNNSLFNPDPSPEVVQLRLQHPFLEYAASHWYYHVRLSEEAGHEQAETVGELCRFFLEGDDGGDRGTGLPTRNLKAWLQLKWPGGFEQAVGVTPLHVAAKFGLLACTRHLIANGLTKVDAYDLFERTPLWWAASEGHAPVIRELVTAGANPDQEDALHGTKPIHTAAHSNHHEAVTALLEAGVDPLTPETRSQRSSWGGAYISTKGDTGLMRACEMKHVETVEAFLPFLKDLDTVHLALAWAASSESSSVVARIIRHPGVDIDSRICGDTPLFIACGKHDAATIKVLLEAGADPNAECFDFEIQGPKDAVIRQSSHLEKTPRTVTPLMKLCRLEKEDSKRAVRARYDEFDSAILKEIFSIFMASGTNLDHRLASGRTVLHGAACSSPVLTRLLLDAGADANVADNDGSTPLHMTKSKEIIEILVEHGGADINRVRPKDGETPLHWLVGNPHVESILKLLEYRPDCNAINAEGNTPLHKIALLFSWNDRVIQSLIEHGADPNVKNNDGRIPLLCLRQNRAQLIDVVDTMMKGGVYINAADRSGHTILFRLFDNVFRGFNEDFGDHAAKLIERGASTAVRDVVGRTIMHVAVAHHTLKARPWATGQQAMSDKTAFDFLLSLGSFEYNAKTVVDYEGNGLLHELAWRRAPRNLSPESGLVPFWAQLVHTLGLDIDAANHAGATPLHILCACRDTEWSTPHGDGNSETVDFVLSCTRNVDAEDRDGITPLHVAVAYGSALFTKKLLAAGANPMAVTNEGLTPLHLAARFRHGNIVGMLLDALHSRTREGKKSDQTSSTPPSRAATATKVYVGPVQGVNALSFGKTDAVTPLYLACLSGRPETVSLLLDAGASLRVGQCDVFNACALFEVEDLLWRITPSPMERRDFTQGLRLADSYRPSIKKKEHQMIEISVHDSARLEEILDMLIQHDAAQPATSPTLSANWACSYISQAVEQNRDYTAVALSAVHETRAVNATGGGTGAAVLTVSKHPYERMFEAVNPAVRAAAIQALMKSGHVKNTLSNQGLLVYLLSRREYYLVEELVSMGVDFLAPRDHHEQTSNLALLVKAGYSQLLAKIGPTVALSKLVGEAEKLNGGTSSWHAFGDERRPGLWYAQRNLDTENHRSRRIRNNPVPLLIEAVSSEKPNMQVVRLLVEELGVSIDEQYYTAQSIPPKLSFVVVPTYSAIFYAALGKSWWAAHQALPYLLRAGGDPNIRNYAGQTALMFALCGDQLRPGLFSKEAARILVELGGADVNTFDAQGRTPLSLAGNDEDLVAFLIAHGATVTAQAVMEAVKAKDIGVLRTFLSSSAVDANIRSEKLTTEKVSVPVTACTKEHVDMRKRMMLSRQLQNSQTMALRGLEADPGQVYPLLQASMMFPIQENDMPSSTAAETLKLGIQLVEALLDHGADPFAKFWGYEPVDYPAKSDFLVRPSDPGQLLDVDDEGDGPRASRKELSPGQVDKAYLYQEFTILHQLLIRGQLVDPILLRDDLDVNHRDAAGRTLLHAACLSAKGPDRMLIAAREVKREGKSAAKAVTCLLAQEKQSMTIFERLVSLGADLTARDNFGRNALHYLVGRSAERKRCNNFAQGCQQTFAHLVEHAPRLLNQADGDGRTPLHYAINRAVRYPGVGSDNVQVPRMVIEAGADPRAVVGGGAMGDTGVDDGVDSQRYHRHTRGDTVLHMLAKSLGDPELCDLFCDIASGRVSTVPDRGIKKAGGGWNAPAVDVNARNAKGETPLFTFAGALGPVTRYTREMMRGYGRAAGPGARTSGEDDKAPDPEAVELLQRLGADFWARDDRGRGLLHVAAAGNARRFRQLMLLGLDVGLEDASQQTPLDVAAACANEEVLELFSNKKNP
ncbi:ankyrin repeat-containing domain protein [Xylariales sp. PMI_506]|nr:ankyrin repeat-containing domain protein [Xylariales sp. PMI_506]